MLLRICDDSKDGEQAPGGSAESKDRPGSFGEFCRRTRKEKGSKGSVLREGKSHSGKSLQLSLSYSFVI